MKGLVSWVRQHPVLALAGVAVGAVSFPTVGGVASVCWPVLLPAAAVAVVSVL